MIWEMPVNFNMHRGRPRKHNEALTTFETLRNFSVNYPIARACIDYRKSQIQQLEWDILSKNADEEPDKRVSTTIRLFFKQPSGPNSTYRTFLSEILEDLLALDAMAIYKQKTFGNQLFRLLPIDGATIQLLLLETGETPEPPVPAYRQIIRGKHITELTTEELIYRMMTPRTNNPYGLAPLETLIVTVNSALRSALYNQAWFEQGNVPEGFIKLPTEVANSPDQVKEWQEYFDLLLQGRWGEQRKIKVIPGEATYEATKKPDDMSFKSFEQWLMQNTCAVFGVPPEELGFTTTVNKATAQAQRELSIDRGLKPLVLFLEEVFTQIIERDMQYPELQFKYIDVDKVDAEEELKRLDLDLRRGIISPDEVRISRGQEPVGIGHYVEGMVSFIGDKSEEEQNKEQIEEEEDKEEEEKQEKEEMAKRDLIVWRKKCFNDLKRGYSYFRSFQSENIDPELIENIEDRLAVVQRDKDSIYKLFDPYISGSYELLKKAEELNENTKKLLKNREG